MAVNSTTDRGNFLTILEATSDTTGESFPVDGSYCYPGSLLFIVVDTAGGTVTIEGNPDPEQTSDAWVELGNFSAAGNLIVEHGELFRHVRASVSGYSSGTATVYLARDTR